MGVFFLPIVVLSDSLIWSGGVGEIMFAASARWWSVSRTTAGVFCLISSNRKKRSPHLLMQERFDIVCCCQIAVNGAAGGLGVR